MSLFLDVDRAASVFSLLFLFTCDELDQEPDEYAFDDALQQVLLGAKLPEPALAKVRSIYDRTVASPLELRQALEQVVEDFRDQRETLLAVLRIILRLSSDEGMLCVRDKARLREVVEVFGLTPFELDRLSPAEQEILSYSCSIGRNGAHSGNGLSSHYEALGCTVEATDEEVRRTYRKLVMQYHPDRTAVAATNGEKVVPCRRRFERIQRAYEAICRERKL